MRAYQEKLRELGLDVPELSERLRKQIKEFQEGVTEYLALKDGLEGMEEDDEEYENVQSEIEEYIELLNETDEKLTKEIEKYAEKKPYYEAKMQHMRNKAAEKKGTTPAQPAAVSAQPTPQPQTIPQTQATPVMNGEPVLEEKKKSSGGWILWGLLGVVGLAVGVNLLKNRD